MRCDRLSASNTLFLSISNSSIFTIMNVLIFIFNVCINMYVLHQLRSFLLKFIITMRTIETSALLEAWKIIMTEMLTDKPTDLLMNSWLRGKPITYLQVQIMDSISSCR